MRRSERLQVAIDRHYERFGGKPAALLLDPRDLEWIVIAWEQFIILGRRFPGQRFWLNNLELTPWPGIARGTGILVDKDFKLLGSISFPHDESE